MSDFKEKIKNREDSLKQTVTQVIGDLNAQNNLNDVNRITYDDAFLSSEISEQEYFRKVYKYQNKKLLDDIEINAPKDYQEKDFVIQERKYGYFAKKGRIKSAKSQKENWKTAVNALKENVQNERYGFELTDSINEDTQDFMLSTKRLMAIENKKRELVSSIITDDAMNALKGKNKVTASVLEKYKTVILHLGPSIETVPKADEAITDEIVFDEESIKAYEAYLRFVVSDPISAIKVAITDTLHTVTSFPEKMVEKKSIPQTLDRLMQVRDRYNAINLLKKHRQMKDAVDAEKNPLGALMTELLPREDAGEEMHEHENDHDHDEKDNFEFIKMMEKLINSDIMSCLSKAGIKYKEGLFGKKEDKNYIKSDGKASKEYLVNVKKMLSEQTDKEKAEKKKLNAEHWANREKAAYDAIKDPQKTENDHYGIMSSIAKIKTDAAGKNKIKYNTKLAEKLESRIAKLNTAIIDLKNKTDNSNKALELDQVKLSRELKGRMEANANKAQYDLAVLLERAKGYINAYDHTVSGKMLNEHGKSIMEDMKLTENEDGWSVYEQKIDTRYNTDTVERINRIANAKSRVQKPEIDNDRDAVTKLIESLINLDKESSNLMHEIKGISKANKNIIVDRLIDFRIRFFSTNELMSHKLNNGNSLISDMFKAISDENDKKKAWAEYNHVLDKCKFLCNYAELFRIENIIGIYNESKLPEEIVLAEEEKAFHQKDFEKQKQSLSLQLDRYLNSITNRDKAQGRDAIRLNLFDENPEAQEEDVANDLEALLAKVRVENFSDVKQAQPVQTIQPVEQHNDQPVQPIQQPIQQVVNEHNANGPFVQEHVIEHNVYVQPVNEHANEQNGNEPPVQQFNNQHREENAGNEPIMQNQYEKRVVSESALEIVRENSLKSTDAFVKFLVYQLMQVNKINKVTWDELKKEAKAWLVGRKLNHAKKKTDITAENVEEIIESFHQELINSGEIIDESQYTAEDKQRFKDDNIDDKQYEEGSIQRLLKEALFVDSSDDCEQMTAREIVQDAVESELQKNFMPSFREKFIDDVANEKNGNIRTRRDNIQVPEQDKAHVRWVIEHFPQNVKSQKAISDFYKEWSKKVGYDMLQGRVLNINTYRRIKCVIDSWQAAIDKSINMPQAKRLMDGLNNVNLDEKVEDRGVANEETTIPNVSQWYGQSCWATSGALIANWYMKNTLKLENPPKVDQMTFLSPENIRLNPYAEEAFRKEKLNPKGDIGMTAEENNIRSFIKPAGSTGNIMTTADVMLSRMSDTAIRHLRFNMPKRDRYLDPEKFTDEQWKKLSSQLFKKVSDLMQSGSGPISLLIPGHYRTIIGFKNGMLRVRDSGLNNGEVEDLLSIETFSNKIKAAVRATGYSFELVYLQKLDNQKKDELRRDYGCEYDENGKLKYNEKDEEILADSPTDMLHNLGITYQRKQKEPDTLLEKFMQDEIYVPKNLNCTQNVETVKNQITQTRKKLGLPDITQKQIKDAEQKQKEFDKIARDMRKLKEEEWKKTAVRSTKAINEERAREVFKDKFTDVDKEELTKKTVVFYKQLKDNKKLKDKEKSVKPTELDILYTDYEEKYSKIENAEKIDDKQKIEQPFGFILSDKEMDNVKNLVENNKNVFANKIVETKESKVSDRNKAIEAIKKGDISLYNHLPAFLKEYYGRQKLIEFFGENNKFKNGEIPEFNDLTKEEKDKLAQRTREPIFRSIINMMIVRRAKDKKGNEAWKRLREYDAYMNQQLILQTLAPMEKAEKDLLKKEQKKLKKSKFDGRDSADTMIANNMTKQRHLAKTMLLMQLGRFDQFDTKKEGKQEKTEVSHFNQTIAEALAHGARIGISLPAGSKDDQKAIFNAWKGKAGDLMFSRFATHDFHRKKAKDKKSFFKEIKLKGMGFSIKKLFQKFHEEKPSSYSDNYGLNLALGGLGKEFNKSVIDDQGKFAHMYQRFRMGDENTCGGMLVGIENSAPGGTCVTNFKQYFGGYNGTSCIGELHNGKAISHGQSAFFSSKENYGDQYSGRVVDLSNFDAKKLSEIIEKFDKKYADLQNKTTSGTTESCNIAKKNLNIINTILSGRILTAQELYKLMRFIGYKPVSAKYLSMAGRSKEGASYTNDEKKYPKEMYEACTENELKTTNKQHLKKKSSYDKFFEEYKPMNDLGEE